MEYLVLPGVVSPWSEHALQITSPKHKYLRSDGELVTQGLNRAGPLLPRSYHSSSTTSSPSGDVFVFGGGMHGRVSNDTWRIRLRRNSGFPSGLEGDPGKMQVTTSLVETTGEAPSPRFAHQSALADELLLVWGGSTALNEAGTMVPPNDDDIYTLNINTNHWTKQTVQPSPCARSQFAACMNGDRFIVYGGRAGERSFSNDLWSLNIPSLKQGNPKWERIEIAKGSPLPAEPWGHKMVAFEEKLYMFGGSRDAGGASNDTWCFDLTTRTWTKLACSGLIPPPRLFHAVTLVGDVMYMFGGYVTSDESLGDIWGFKLRETKWYRFPNMDFQPYAVCGHIMVAIEGRMLVVGGKKRNKRGSEGTSMIYLLDTNLLDYPTHGDQIRIKSTPGVGQSPLTTLASSLTEERVSEDTITGAMSALEILQYLVVHGCSDISNDLDFSHVSEHPVSSGGFGDVYCATLRNGDRVGLKCIRMLVGSTIEEQKPLKVGASSRTKQT